VTVSEAGPSRRLAGVGSSSDRGDGMFQLCGTVGDIVTAAARIPRRARTGGLPPTNVSYVAAARV